MKASESYLIVNDTCVFNQDSHVAFTTLKKWKGNLYLAFREGCGHHATLTNKGKIRVMKKKMAIGELRPFSQMKISICEIPFS